jgi:competence protein ComEC
MPQSCAQPNVHVRRIRDDRLSPIELIEWVGRRAFCYSFAVPKDLFDPSFQLTFLSVLAIVVIAWPLLSKLVGYRWLVSVALDSLSARVLACSQELFARCCFGASRSGAGTCAQITRLPPLQSEPRRWLERYHVQGMLRYTFGAVLVSASVQLMLLPLMIVYFHRLSLASLVLNIVVSILLAALVAVALLALLLSHVSLALAAPFLKLADAITWVMVTASIRFRALDLHRSGCPSIQVRRRVCMQSITCL